MARWRMGDKPVRYIVRLVLEGGTWIPYTLFEVDAKGKITPFDPTGELPQVILDREWIIAKNSVEHAPHENRFEDISEGAADLLKMEMRIEEDRRRKVGDIRPGDYLNFNTEQEEEYPVAYGRVLKKLEGDFFLFMVLGADLDSKAPFFSHEEIRETDGKKPLKRIGSASELEPGEIYAVNSYGQEDIHPDTIRMIRQSARSPGYVHVPDKALDGKSPEGFKRR